MPTPQAKARRLACALLAEIEEPPGEVVEVEVSDGTLTVRVVIGAVRQVAAGEQQELPAPDLTPLDRLILAQSTSEPQTMTRLANRCDHDTDSYFRERMRRLVGLGVLVRDFRGFRLP